MAAGSVIWTDRRDPSTAQPKAVKSSDEPKSRKLRSLNVSDYFKLDGADCTRAGYLGNGQGDIRGPTTISEVIRNFFNDHKHASNLDRSASRLIFHHILL
ncbi:hypothetical protein NXS19_003293 [Fusarium pseudograminearum]|nr:hypothetical protein NXS19_003293 [Fusarium pseudograminearum]